MVFFSFSFFLLVMMSLRCVLIGNLKKVKHLLDLPKAETHLSLWKADLSEEGSFHEAIKGCNGVFHVATPMDFESKDPEVLIYNLIYLIYPNTFFFIIEKFWGFELNTICRCEVIPLNYASNYSLSPKT